MNLFILHFFSILATILTEQIAFRESYIHRIICQETIKTASTARHAILNIDPFALSKAYNLFVSSFYHRYLSKDRPFLIINKVLRDNEKRDEQYYAGYISAVVPLRLKLQTEGAIIKRTTRTNFQVTAPRDVWEYFKVQSLEELLKGLPQNKRHHAHMLYEAWKIYNEELQNTPPVFQLICTSVIPSKNLSPVSRYLARMEILLSINSELDHAYTYPIHNCLLHLFEYLRHLLILASDYSIDHKSSFLKDDMEDEGFMKEDQEDMEDMEGEWYSLKYFWLQFKHIRFDTKDIKVLYAEPLIERPLWFKNDTLYSIRLPETKQIEGMELRYVPTTGSGYAHWVLLRNKLIFYISLKLINPEQTARHIFKHGLDFVYDQKSGGLPLSKFMDGMSQNRLFKYEINT